MTDRTGMGARRVLEEIVVTIRHVVACTLLDWAAMIAPAETGGAELRRLVDRWARGPL